MRTVDYVSQIKETADELKRLENKEENPRLRKRLQLLRILKSGLTPFLTKACAMVGYSDKHGREIWQKISYGKLDKQLLPPYSPELNPVERFFQELRRELKNKVYDSYTEVEKAVEEIFKRYLTKPEAVKKLTNFHWLHTTPT